MSTASGAKAGKERGALTNFFSFVLVAAIAVFFLNFYFGNQRNAEENKAREYIAESQVLSQQIAKFSAEAVSGGFEAFSELKSTRGRIETLVRNLLNGNPDDNVPAYQGQAGVGDPLQKLVDSWTPVNNSAQRIAEREELVLGLADTAKIGRASCRERVCQYV